MAWLKIEWYIIRIFIKLNFLKKPKSLKEITVYHDCDKTVF